MLKSKYCIAEILGGSILLERRREIIEFPFDVIALPFEVLLIKKINKCDGAIHSRCEIFKLDRNGIEVSFK